MAIYKRDVDELRILRKAVTRKVSRLKTRKGVWASGTQVDPRLPLDQEKRLTRKGLNAYKVRMRKFLSRETQFVPGKQGRPIDQNLWREYQRAEREFNAARMGRNVKFDHVQTPYGMSVAEYQAMLKPAHPSLVNDAANANYHPISRRSVGVASNNALRALIANVIGKMSDEYYQETINTNRRVAIQMSNEIGNGILADKIMGLSDEQFDLLWRHSRFASHLVLQYEWFKDKREGAISEVAERAISAAENEADWALQVHF